MFGPTAQPLTVSFGQQTWQLARVDLLQMISLHSRQAGHPVSLEIDDAALRAWVASIAKEIDEPVQEPPFHFSRGSVHITRASQTRASQQGRSMDEGAGVHVVHDALLAGRPMWTCRYRSPIRASSEDPRALGITELMQTAGTSFLGSVPERKHNIHLAAQRLTASWFRREQPSPSTIRLVLQRLTSDSSGVTASNQATIGLAPYAVSRAVSAG